MRTRRRPRLTASFFGLRRGIGFSPALGEHTDGVSAAPTIQDSFIEDRVLEHVTLEDPYEEANPHLLERHGQPPALGAEGGFASELVEEQDTVGGPSSTYEDWAGSYPDGVHLGRRKVGSDWGYWISPEGQWHDVDFEHASWAHSYALENDVPFERDNFRPDSESAQIALLKMGWIRVAGSGAVQAPAAPLSAVLAVARQLAKNFDVGDVIYIDRGWGTDYTRVRVLRPGQLMTEDLRRLAAVARQYWQGQGGRP